MVLKKFVVIIFFIIGVVEGVFVVYEIYKLGK